LKTFNEFISFRNNYGKREIEKNFNNFCLQDLSPADLSKIPL